MIKQSLKYCLLTGWVMLVAGCIKENTDDCFSTIRLRFSYTLHTESGNLFGRDVHHIRACVFDANGVLNTVVSEQGDVLTNDYVMTLPLSPGSYTIVAWGTQGTDFSRSYTLTQALPDDDLVPGQTRIEQLRTALNCKPTPDAEGNLRPEQSQFDDLFYGVSGSRSTDGRSEYTVIPVKLEAGQTVERTIELIRNTNVVQLTVKGLTGLLPQTGFDAWVTGKNVSYNYDNSAVNNAPRIHYEPRDFLTQESLVRMNISIQRLEWIRTAGEPLMLYVKDLKNNKILTQLDLVELLRKANSGQDYRNQEDFDREYIYPILLSYSDDMTLKIYVNDWLIEEIKPEL